MRKLHFPLLYQVRDIILSPKGEKKQLGLQLELCVYRRLENIILQRDDILWPFFLPHFLSFLPPFIRKGWIPATSLYCKHHFSAATCGIPYFPSSQVSALPWPHVCCQKSHSHSPPIFPCSVSPSLALSWSIPARRDQLWQMDRHKHCSLSCPR